MPAIINIPAKVRNPRGMTEEDAKEYGTLLKKAKEGEGVQVDGTSPSYEAAYSRGDRVRKALRAFSIFDEKVEIVVNSFQNDDETYSAALILKK